MAKFHRASNRQVAFIQQLAQQTGAVLPWGYEGYSADRASKLINQLKKRMPKQEAADTSDQTTLFT